MNSSREEVLFSQAVEKSDAERARFEDLFPEYTQQRDRPRPQPVPTLRCQQRKNTRMSTRITDRFANRFEQRWLFVQLLPLLREWRAHAPEDVRRTEKADGIDNE